jgi:hypothetical protein
MTTMTDQTPRPLTEVGTKIEPVALDTEDLAVEAIVYEGLGPLHLTMAIGDSEADHRDGRRYRVEWMQTIPATALLAWIYDIETGEHVRTVKIDLMPTMLNMATLGMRTIPAQADGEAESEAGS